MVGDSSGAKRYRVGIDVGGTFTDAVCLDSETGRISRAKAHTSPDRVVDGQIAAIRNLGIETARIDSLLNGTTVVTNAILTRSGAPTAIITTAGFEDALETGRERRVGGGLHMYDLRQRGPEPLAPRFLRFPLCERIAADGRILVPLDESQVRELANRVIGLGIRVVAVCCLFSYLNPAHEKRIRDILLKADPGLTVVLSSDVAPEIREYERASTTYINAYTVGPFSDYISGLAGALSELEATPDIFVMQSNGGLVPADPQQVKPAQIVESGPAAGVVAAAFIGEAAGYDDIIAFDVGGTTAKACLLRDGRPNTTSEFKVGGYYPVKYPSIDLVEIGTGGGSIAWIDEGRALRVGPRSAGAHPGPACYARGGERPTLTDANLVLGRLNPENFLGGEWPLDLRRAAESIERHISRPLGLSLAAAAEGIVTIANTQMAGAIRLISTRKGYDPRDFVLVAYGGAGPLQAAEIAREVGLKGILVPQGSGTLSALGLLVGDLVADTAYTFLTTDPLQAANRIEEIFRSLEVDAYARVEQPGLQTSLRRRIDVRYVGQRWELSVDIADPFGAEAWKRAIADFHAAHQRAYQFHDPKGDIEITSLRVEARTVMPRPAPTSANIDPVKSLPQPERRDVVADGAVISCSIFRRRILEPGHRFEGPAIVEDLDTTVWVPPGMAAQLDGLGNILIMSKGQ